MRHGGGCVGTQCVGPAPVGPDMLTGLTGPMAAIALPAVATDCREDVNGDGVVDHQRAAVANVTPSVAAQAVKHLYAATAAGHFKYLVDVRGIPASGCGAVDVPVFRGDDDVDDDGLPDSTLAERLAGNEVLQAAADSLWPDGLARSDGDRC